jgi:hypothetical protein
MGDQVENCRTMQHAAPDGNRQLVGFLADPGEPRLEALFGVGPAQFTLGNQLLRALVNGVSTPLSSLPVALCTFLRAEQPALKLEPGKLHVTFQ